jgi:beta-1,4-mannosyl-glycoprotein beta-1,4-N-acetylglucosaminyltransferase
MKPRIFDCFCYFNEDMLLELRMETLADFVDYFVISEAVYTQVGDPKPLNFNPDRFAKFKDKIRYLVVDHFPPGEQGAWRNENYQRDFLVNGLHDARPDDWVMVSDLDEIPRPEQIRLFNPGKYLRGDFQQHCYAYFLNNQFVENGQPSIWQGSKITTFKYLQEFFGNVNSVRSYKSKGMLRSIKRSFFRKFRTQKIPDGGWHFSWVMPPELILLKMASIAEQEYIRDEFRNVSYVESRIRSGQDVLGRPFQYVPQAITEGGFPAYLCQNLKKYEAFILPA